jgi:methylamine dehydrogenase light chain
MTVLDALDRVMEDVARELAQRSSRRGALARLGVALVGGVVLPMLPIDRTGRARMAHASEFAKTAQTTDPTRCDYWRHCSVDGDLCSCCGGSVNECPPGTMASSTSWIGTCINPDDNQAYLIAYQDCCGKGACDQCTCSNTEGEMPSYRPELNNDIVWCFGAPSMVYHCSSQILIGKA